MNLVPAGGEFGVPDGESVGEEAVRTDDKMNQLFALQGNDIRSWIACNCLPLQWPVEGV